MSKKNRVSNEPPYDPSGSNVAFVPPELHDGDYDPVEHQLDWTPALRILIGIPYYEGHAALLEACNQTWAKEKYRKIGDWLLQIQFFDGKLLGVADGYLDLPIKVQAICKWALERKYDFLFKADVDTFIWIDRLMASGFEQHDYSGWTSEWKMPAETNYCSGGAGYWLSKKAMKIVAEAALTKDTAEDRWVGRVLFDAGIKLHRNPNHAHGRHDEVATNSELLTMHPCSSIHWMRKMQDA